MWWDGACTLVFYSICEANTIAHPGKVSVASGSKDTSVEFDHRMFPPSVVLKKENALLNCGTDRCIDLSGPLTESVGSGIDQIAAVNYDLDFASWAGNWSTAAANARGSQGKVL